MRAPLIAALSGGKCELELRQGRPGRVRRFNRQRRGENLRMLEKEADGSLRSCASIDRTRLVPAPLTPPGCLIPTPSPHYTLRSNGRFPPLPYLIMFVSNGTTTAGPRSIYGSSSRHPLNTLTPSMCTLMCLCRARCLSKYVCKVRCTP